MKIAVITNHVPSFYAHSINTVKIAQGFYKLGHTVEILVVRQYVEDKNRIKVKNINKFYGIHEDIKIKFFFDKSPSYFREVRLIGPIMNKFKSFLETIFPNLKYILDPERLISQYCSKSNFDFAFCRTTFNSLYYNVLNGIPSILDLHGFDIPELSHLVKIRNTKSFLGIMTISEILKKKFEKMGYPSNKINVMDNAVDLEMFDKIIDNKLNIRKKLNLPLNKKIVLYSGIISSDRSIDTIIEASNILDRNIFSFYFLGRGIFKKSIRNWKKYLSKNNIKSDIHFLGFKMKAFVPFYLKAADVLLATFSLNCPSLSYMSPVKMIEYMASKVPLIATKVGRTIDLCNNNECIFTEPINPKDLSEKIKLIIRDKSLRDKVVQNAYKKAKNYSLNKRCEKILDLYLKVKN